MNEKANGFSVTEALIMLTILSFVGTAGWLVINRDEAKDLSSSASPLSQAANTPEQTTETMLKPQAGYKTHQQNGISFEYPESWTMNEFGQDLTSPDHASEADNRHGSTNVLSGGWISIQYPAPSVSYYKNTLDNYKSWIGEIYSDYKGDASITSINDKKIIQFPSQYRHAEIENFGFDSESTVYFPADSNPAKITLYYKIGEDKEEYKKAYEHLLNTLKYN